MYLKILVESTEITPMRTLITADVEQVEFFLVQLTEEEFKKNCSSLWLVLGRDPWMNIDKGGQAKLGGVIYKAKGKYDRILFNETAFLCNDYGKVVERFMVK